jgi:Cytochrome P450
LYHLAAEPKYASALREEVEAVVKELGWTKEALDRMLKIDSFLKESQRLNGLGNRAYHSVFIPASH